MIKLHDIEREFVIYDDIKKVAISLHESGYLPSNLYDWKVIIGIDLSLHFKYKDNDDNWQQESFRYWLSRYSSILHPPLDFYSPSWGLKIIKE